MSQATNQNAGSANYQPNDG